MTRKRAVFIGLVVLVVGALPVLGWIGFNLLPHVPSADEAIRAHEVGELVDQRFATREITVLWSAVGHHIQLDVGGPDARKSADEICAFVSALREERNLPRVVINFSDGSTWWTVTPD